MIPELLIMFGINGIHKGFNSLEESSPIDKYGVYMDGNGDFRMYPSRVKVYYGHNKNGEYVIKSQKRGTVLVNVDLEESKLRKQEAKNKGYEFYLRSNSGGKGMHKLGNDDIYGPRYCKIDNDNIYYVKREINYFNADTNEFCTGFFYMDMNYNLVAPSESTIESNKNIDYSLYKKIMNECNLSKRKYNMRTDIIMYLGNSSGFKYDHLSLRCKK